MDWNTRQWFVGGCLGLGLLLAGCGDRTSGTVGDGVIEAGSPSTAGEARATAAIAPRSGSALQGEATFTQKGEWVEMALEVRNATPGLLAVHIHEIGDCSAEDAESAGPHWNPTEEAHGKLGSTDEAHLGDIGNVQVGPDGTGSLTFRTDRWTIGGPASTSILGRSLVVHAREDDYETQPTGDAGDRIGCGVVQAPEPASRR
jgi:superoxide dismutase, Cu-Zn family